jgi:hypothetical protein
MPLRVHYFQLTPEDVDFLVVASVSGDVIIILTTLLADPADLERQLQHQQNAYAPAARSHKKNISFGTFHSLRNGMKHKVAVLCFLKGRNTLAT